MNVYFIKNNFNNNNNNNSHGLRTCIEQHCSEDSFGVLKVDMTNGFLKNQVECAKHFTELLPWVSWCYGPHPLLWYALGCLSSKSVTNYGINLDPCYFCLS